MILHPPTFNAAFKVAGTASFRLASTQFLKTRGVGYGGNLQNIPDEQRRVFIPRPGNTFVQCDLEGAEAVAVALLVPEGNFRDLVRLGIKIHNFLCIKLFPEKFTALDISPALTPAELKAHPNYKAFVKYVKSLRREYDLAKRTVHGCLTADHEVLTPAGWRPIEQVTREARPTIYVYDPATKTGRFEAVESLVFHDYDGDLHEITNAYGTMSCVVTQEHRMPYVTNKRFKVATPAQLPRGCSLPCANFFEPTRGYPSAIPRLVAALHADGYIDPYERVIFHFKRERKIKRLLLLLKDAGYGAQRITENKDGTTTIVCDAMISSLLITYGKALTWNWLKFDADFIYAYLWECIEWDGHQGPTYQAFHTVNKEHAEIAHTLCRLVGIGSTLHATERDETRQTLYRIGLNGRRFIAYESCKHEVRKCLFSESVYCFKTSTGFFYVRRANAIHITGNSNYGMAWKTFLETVLKGTRGRVVLTAAEAKRFLAIYFEVFPEIKFFQIGLEEAVKNGVTIRNLFGHPVTFVRRFTTDLARTGISWIPQSTVGQCSNIAAVKLDEYIRANNKPWLINNIVHDSILAEAPADQVQELADVTAKCLTFTFQSPLDGWECTIGVEKQIGSNWGKHDETENPNGMKVI